MAQKKLKSKQKKQIKIPKTVQDSIPYEHVYANGTFELEPNMYSRTCKLSDTNFFVASEVEQENILNTFAEVLNILPYKTVMQITCFNRSVEKESMYGFLVKNTLENGLMTNVMDKDNYLLHQVLFTLEHGKIVFFLVMV